MSYVGDLEGVIKSWKNYILTGELSEYTLEIENSVPPEMAAIALYLDMSTVRASGETLQYYQGYSKAAQDVLHFIGVELLQDDSAKKVLVKRSLAYHETQKKLKEFLWGEGS